MRRQMKVRFTVESPGEPCMTQGFSRENIEAGMEIPSGAWGMRALLKAVLVEKLLDRGAGEG